MWGDARACVFGVLTLTLAGCLPDNPAGWTETANDSSEDTTQTTGGTGGEVAGMLGCPAGEICPLVFVAQTLDDRIEVFAPRHAPAFRGTINLDLNPGTSTMGTSATLDEPYGMSLSGGFLHVIAGHYPTRTAGSMVSFPVSFLSGYDPGDTVAVTDYFNGGAFSPPVQWSNFGELEPIFMYEHDVQGRLLIGTFNNNLFSTEDTWTGVGKLIVAEANDPTNFATAELSGLVGGDCLGAAQIVLIDDETNQAAVACDGNEAVALLNLGDIGTGSVDAAAAAISGTLCEIIGPRNDKRVRYVAPDGVNGALVTYGPGAELLDDGSVWRVGPGCPAGDLSAEIGTGGTAQLGQIIPFLTGYWLVASGSGLAGAQRDVFVLRGGSRLEVCGSIGGFESAWDTQLADVYADPVALALTADGTGLIVGAAPPSNKADDQRALGKVLWAELPSDPDDPCSMTATSVTDLTDGVGDHALAADPADQATWRRGPNVVVIAEVLGG